MRNSFLVSAKAEKDSRCAVVHGDLIEKLFGEGGFADCGRADEEVKPGPDAVECAAQVGKASFPAG